MNVATKVMFSQISVKAGIQKIDKGSGSYGKNNLDK